MSEPNVIKVLVDDVVPNVIKVDSPGPPGPAGTVTIGTVSTTAYPGPPSITNSGTSQNAVLDFTLVTGEKGDKGDAATVTVGAVSTTAWPGPASVTNSGTANAAVLDFVLVSGEKGDKGDKGDKGEQGDVSLAQLEAYLSPLRPIVINQPTNISGNVGDSLSISCLGGILPNTHLNLTYQWQLSTDAGVSYTNVTGATSPSIPFNPALVGNNGLYRCRLTNAFGSQDTDAVSVAIDGAIQHLYGVNDRGIAWDLDRMDHLFQTSVGVTPVAAYGDPVGLVIGRERGGLDNLGPELKSTGVAAISGTGPIGTYNNTTGEGTVTRTDAANQGTVNFSVIVGKKYRFEINNTSAVALVIRGTTTYYNATANVVSTGIFVANNATLQITSSSGSASFIVVSLKEMADDNWFIQPTSSRRPTYARRPKSGIRNLLRFTQSLDNVAWSRVNTTVVADANNFWKLQETAVTNQFIITQAPIGGNVSSGLVNTFSVVAKAAERSWIRIALGGTSYGTNDAWFNLANGTIGTIRNATATITNLGDGFYRCSVTATTIATGTVTAQIFLANANGVAVYAGTTGNGALIGQSQLERDGAMTAYQVVTNQFDVTETGQPSINYLWFDGIDDCMQSATAIDFSNSDEMTVSVGQRKNVTSNTLLIELASGSSIGTVSLFATSNSFIYRSRGSAVADNIISGFGNIAQAVLTGQSKISTDLNSLSVNATTTALVSIDQGTGNWGNNIMNLGSRNQAGSFFQGEMYSGFMINRLLNPLVLADYEKYWVGAKSGIDLP